MDRRTFLNWVGLGAIATSLPIALAACDSGTDLPIESNEASPETGATEAGGGFVAVGSASMLEGNGAISDSKFAGGSGKLIVFKSGDDVVALDANCPHAGCAVDWDGTELICPCHNSKFSADGSLLSGPAQEGLGSFEAKVEGDQVLVKTS